MRRYVWLLGIVSLVMGGASGCATKEAADEAPSVTVQAAPAEDKAIQREVIADAILYPKDQAALVPKINAPIQKFYVDRGSPVHAGQLLAELESRDIASAVADNQGAYQQAEASYQTALQKAQQDLTLAKQQLDAQQRLYDNRESLLKQGAAETPALDDGACDPAEGPVLEHKRIHPIGVQKRDHGEPDGEGDHYHPEVGLKTCCRSGRCRHERARRLRGRNCIPSGARSPRVLRPLAARPKPCPSQHYSSNQDHVQYKRHTRNCRFSSRSARTSSALFTTVVK